MKFEIEFDPDISSVIKATEKALKALNSIPMSTWSLVEDELLDFQAEHWDSLEEVEIMQSTRDKKARDVKKGRKIVVGRSGRKESAKYVDEGAHHTGFLRERLVSKKGMRGYNTTRFEDTESIKKGAFYFGVDPSYFSRDYPGGLADFILGAPGKPTVSTDIVTALIGIGRKESKHLALYLWDLMWIRFEKELKDAF